MEQQNWFPKSTFQQSAFRVLHEQGMAVVYGVSQLESKYCISLKDH